MPEGSNPQSSQSVPLTDTIKSALDSSHGPFCQPPGDFSAEGWTGSQSAPLQKSSFTERLDAQVRPCPLSLASVQYAARTEGSLRLLVVSFFDGIGCVWQALQSTPFDIQGFSFEVDENCCHVLGQHHHVARCGDVRGFNPAWLESKIRDLQPHACLLAGGSPCQQLSSLGNQVGLEGSDSKLFWDFVSARDAAHAVCKSCSVCFFWLLENVVPASKHQRALGLRPLLLNAADTGWHNRRRLAWFNWDLPPQMEALVTYDDKGGVLRPECAALSTHFTSVGLHFPRRLVAPSSSGCEQRRVS